MFRRPLGSETPKPARAFDERSSTRTCRARLRDRTRCAKSWEQHVGSALRVLPTDRRAVLETLRVLRPGATACNSGSLSDTWVIPDFEPIAMIPSGRKLTAFHSNEAHRRIAANEATGKLVVLSREGRSERPRCGEVSGCRRRPGGDR